MPLGAQAAQHVEQLGHLSGGQDGRRLVENEQMRSSVERLHDLDALPFSGGEVLQPCPGVDLQTKACG